jgi:hypothetical protein
MDENRKISLSREQMQQIARYELVFDELVDDFSMENGDVVVSEAYSFTLYDLKLALINLKFEDPYMDEFWKYWLNPIWTLRQSFGLAGIIGWVMDEDIDDTPEHLREYAGELPLSDSAQFRKVWLEFDKTREQCEYEDVDNLSEYIDFDYLLDNLEQYEANKDKPIEQWQFTSEEKEDYIIRFDDENDIKNATENQLALCRKFVEELCDEDNDTALRMKGYACYGGNQLYPCDWNTSRDCMIRLFDLTDDSQYANTLGYIYYYGRCNGGVPEYDKAFYYFSIAAANGMYEGMYKLADMYMQGYGCKKSPRTARRLYEFVYEDTLKRFLEGDDTNFADAALRIGNVFAKGISENENPMMAYLYYLQAEYAAKLRAEDSDFFGNTTVLMNIQKAIDETKLELPEDYFSDYLDFYEPIYFEELVEDGNRCELTYSEDEEGNTVLTAKRLKPRRSKEPKGILITIPWIQYCERRTDVSFTLIEPSELWLKMDAESVRYDYCEFNHEEQQYEFYYDEDLVAYVKCGSYRVYAPETPEPYGEEYRIASIRFGESGRTYDYICDFEDVKVGDKVIVEGYDGETEVTVTKITQKRESELEIPIERYKKILRKKN